jgi:hypothetical protein
MLSYITNIELEFYTEMATVTFSSLEALEETIFQLPTSKMKTDLVVTSYV